MKANPSRYGNTLPNTAGIVKPPDGLDSKLVSLLARFIVLVYNFSTEDVDVPDRSYPPEGLVICNLQTLMDERRLSLAEVSRLTGLSRPTVRKLRANRFEGVSTATVARLCSALQVGVGVLLTHKSRSQLRIERKALVGAHKS